MANVCILSVNPAILLSRVLQVRLPRRMRSAAILAGQFQFMMAGSCGVLAGLIPRMHKLRLLGQGVPSNSFRASEAFCGFSAESGLSGYLPFKAKQWPLTISLQNY
ncbi:hypothetical protein BJX66DRAFT_289263 [Aspergillus keveii]|uniref:Uncharacterized protein n=1 Tax=Aspergillus keveii TaxID=714993 RepID=A0ABR4GQK2_9EURO